MNTKLWPTNGLPQSFQPSTRTTDSLISLEAPGRMVLLSREELSSSIKANGELLVVIFTDLKKRTLLRFTAKQWVTSSTELGL